LSNFKKQFGRGNVFNLISTTELFLIIHYQILLIGSLHYQSASTLLMYICSLYRKGKVMLKIILLNVTALPQNTRFAQLVSFAAAMDQLINCFCV